jgi:hypothetical protein
MKFLSAFESIDYVIKPSRPQLINGVQYPPTEAIRAEFKRHVFDSERAQAIHAWTDEVRELVEQRLLNHPDFGRRRASQSGLANTLSVAKDHADYQGPDPSSATCIVVVPSADGAEQCGDAVVPGAVYCSKHLNELASSLKKPRKPAKATA